MSRILILGMQTASGLLTIYRTAVLNQGTATLGMQKVAICDKSECQAMAILAMCPDFGNAKQWPLTIYQNDHDLGNRDI